MVLQFESYSMILVLLSLLCNYNNLILILYQEKITTLMKGGFLLGSKLEMIGTINKDELPQFMYKPR